MKRIALRKILKVRRALKDLKVVVSVSAAYASLGLALYLFVYASGLILMESLLWLLEALIFLGSLMALHFATSKTLYGARYEVLRIENIVALFLAVTPGFRAFQFIIKPIPPPATPSPAPLSAYLLGGGFLSYFLAKWLGSVKRKKCRAKVVVTEIATKRLQLDAILEFAAGASIIASSLAMLPILESLMVITMSVYVLYEALNLSKNIASIMLGLRYPRELKRKIALFAQRETGYKARKVIVKPLGSFIEAELWMEVPGDTTVEDAYRIATATARKVVDEFPEVLRALVIMVPKTIEPPTKPELAVASTA